MGAVCCMCGAHVTSSVVANRASCQGWRSFCCSTAIHFYMPELGDHCCASSCLNCNVLVVQGGNAQICEAGLLHIGANQRSPPSPLRASLAPPLPHVRSHGTSLTFEPVGVRTCV